MAKIKFDPSINPLNKEHYGFTFQRNNYGFSMFPAGKNDRKRYPLQWEKMQFMSKAIRNWRNMSAETKNAWNVFATTYPQPTDKDPNTFLTGYQLFLKRNFYRFLHEGINFEFLTEPELTELPTPDFSIEILENGMCVDVTEEYIRNHGILPEIGQFVICRVIPIATNSGQFFAPFIATLEVQEVYIDGLVCSFNFSSIPENIVFSLYMSRPVYESNQYAGTKFRYMGCFKPTKFIQLTDTPETYEGAAGKVVTVKEDETGLEFIDATGCEICPPVPGEADAGKVITVNPAGDGYELAEGGGGSFDCDDLLDCGIIQSIIGAINNSFNATTPPEATSAPQVKFGLLYNWYVLTHPNLPPIGSGFTAPTKQDVWNLYQYAGGGSFASGIGRLQIDSTDFWLNPLPTVNNDLYFNAKGAGGIKVANGTYSAQKQHMYLMYSDDFSRVSTLSYDRDTPFLSTTGLNGWMGASIRLIRKPSPYPNGYVGSLIGNTGRIYKTITINGVEWVADNLAETHFNNGIEIPFANNPTEWADNSHNNLPIAAAPSYLMDEV